MTKEWRDGFGAGVLWCAAELTRAHDQPTMAADLCRAGGVTLRDLQQCDLADADAVRKIIREMIDGQPVELPAPSSQETP